MIPAHPMAAPIRISCVNKAPATSPSERIESVGGIGPGGARWKLSEEQAIAAVENGTYAFYVSEHGWTVDVIVAARSGHTYLRTRGDREQPEMLLSLPECP
jgi:hypothetical protein